MFYPWWESATFYHLYLPSFADGNDDGFGDLAGVRRHIDYLAWLGVDAVWLSPFCTSMMEDFGYDITDYRDVDPAFGTMADLRSLVEELHARDIRVVMDLVVNHSSRHHPWFLDAATARDGPYHEYYIWRDPGPHGGPPNNWRSINDPDRPGSAWEWYPELGQFVLCSFAPTQPDLNWANPAVVDEVCQIAHFWLGLGIDGFRLDMIDFIGKDPLFRDEPDKAPGDDYFSHSTVQLCLGQTLGHLRRLREATDGYADRVLIGEVGGLMPLERLVALHGDGRGLDLPHNFRLLFLPWQTETLQSFVDAYDAALVGRGSPNWVLTNHDLPRTTVRGRELSRLGLMMLLTLPGAAFLYYGEEIGMTNVEIPADRQRDPWRTPETGLSRDPSRTPMQWSAGPHAGFSTVEPWLPVAEDHTHLNVAAQRDEPNSTLALTRRLVAARRQPALLRGTYAPHATGTSSVMAYTRTVREQQALVMLNLGTDHATVSLPGVGWSLGIGTHDRSVPPGSMTLAGHEGITLWR